MKDSELLELFDSHPDLSESDKSCIIQLMEKYVQRAFDIARGFVQYRGEDSVTDKDLVLALKAQALDHFYQSDTTDKKDPPQDVSCYSSTEQEDRAYEEILQVDEKWCNWNPEKFPHTVIKMAIDKTTHAICD